jgi:hypothetical protein
MDSIQGLSMTGQIETIEHKRAQAHQSPVEKRVGYIDIAKGIGIILVVMGHNDFSLISPFAHKLIYSLHMPMFFFMSGMFFKPDVPFEVPLGSLPTRAEAIPHNSSPDLFCQSLFLEDQCCNGEPPSFEGYVWQRLLYRLGAVVVPPPSLCCKSYGLFLLQSRKSNPHGAATLGFHHDPVYHRGHESGFVLALRIEYPGQDTNALWFALWAGCGAGQWVIFCHRLRNEHSTGKAVYRKSCNLSYIRAHSRHDGMVFPWAY